MKPAIAKNVDNAKIAAQAINLLERWIMLADGGRFQSVLGLDLKETSLAKDTRAFLSDGGKP